MMQTFIFRSAVNSAALWNLSQKIREKPNKEKLLVFYDDGSKIKTVMK